jgi:hypothetical protein
LPWIFPNIVYHYLGLLLLQPGIFSSPAIIPTGNHANFSMKHIFTTLPTLIHSPRREGRMRKEKVLIKI